MSALPTGTVTLVFTDIEGSTQLLNELGDAYAGVLAEHRRLLRDTFQRHAGLEVDTQGDAFFYAFARASDAISAAEDAQRALTDSTVRVRMGIHTGEPTVTDEGYVGADVHLAARIAAAGHGGQVLLSETTARLVPDGLRDLGVQRLKDVGEFRLFQLGDGHFPPLRTLNASNLRLPLTPLIGRKKELADVLRLLRPQQARLVTLTGTGGIGKTRFALDVAHQLVEDFPHGVWVVDLSALRDPALVLPTIASTLGAKGELAEHVVDKELLLVLDNFEQVVAAAGEVGDLLRRCPRVQLLVTSREPLHIAGEREYPVPPLAEAPAVELFRERAQAVDPDLDVPWETASAIVERLDRLPLAIELAAARVKALAPESILSRLSQRLPVLTGGARDAPERHRTLQAMIEWSYELLSPQEQALFRRLSVFAGGCSVDSAERVCDADIDTLHSLVDKSLLRYDDDRYSMLETIREYAANRLAESEDADDVRRRHGEYFLELAERLEVDLWERHASVERLDREHSNVRAALAWSRDVDDGDLLVRLANASTDYWLIRGHFSEAREWLEWALEQGDDGLCAPRAKAYVAASAIAYAQGDWERAFEHAAEGVALYRELGDKASLALALNRLANATSGLGSTSDARSLYEEAVGLACEAGHTRWHAVSLLNLGALSVEERRYEAAKSACEAALVLFEELENKSGIAICFFYLARTGIGEGRLEAAAAALATSVRIYRELGRQPRIAPCLEAFAAIAAGEGALARSVRLLGAADAIRQETGSRPTQSERSLLEQTRASLSRWVDEAAFAEAWQAGSDMSLEDAVEYALRCGDA